MKLYVYTKKDSTLIQKMSSTLKEHFPSEPRVSVLVSKQQSAVEG